jgi:3-phosphoglycerate kinase
VRCDFNVPLIRGRISDPPPDRCESPHHSVRSRSPRRNSSLSHLGRPKGGTPELRLKPVVDYLSLALKIDVLLAPEVYLSQRADFALIT